MSAIAIDQPKIEFTEKTLKNGLRVILSEDHIVPIVAVNLWYNVGSADDTPGRTGLAHLFEHMMFEGSANIDKSEHFKLISSIGGVNNASTSSFRTNYFEWAPSQHLELLLWLEADRMGGLLKALNQETLDNQRDVVKNERRQTMENVPYGSWVERLPKLIFPEGHPYHAPVIGSMDDLDGASLKDVKEFFTTHYSPNNAVLTIVGDFDPKTAMKWVEKYFGGIARNPKVPPRPQTELPLTIGREARESLRERVPLPGVFMAYRAPAHGTRESDALTVAGVVVGEGRGSRMYQRLVLESIAAQASLINVEQPGTSWSVVVGIAYPGIFDDLLEKELLKVIDSLKNEPITNEEMERARAQIESQFLSQLTSMSNRADFLSENAMLLGDPSKANERLQELLSITSEEISKVAKEVFVEENRAVVTFLRRPRDVKLPKK